MDKQPMRKKSTSPRRVISPRIKRTIINNSRPKIFIDTPEFEPDLEVVYSNDDNGFFYKTDGRSIRRVLNIQIDPNYQPDPDYGSPQAWLINNRQGDDQNRLSEYVLNQEEARNEEYGMVGESTLNKGIVWAPIPEVYMNNDQEVDRYFRVMDYEEE
jgi:hypothetical protein